jgi:hypothetical protein
MNYFRHWTKSCQIWPALGFSSWMQMPWAAGQRAFRLLGEAALRVTMIVFSAECSEQVFPYSRESPTILRAPLTAISLRVGFEQALRARTELYA